MSSGLAASRVLITGGSGTLGAAILRTAERENWNYSFTVYSRSELRQAQMRARYPHVRYILGDVRDYDRLAAAVAGHDLIIHAAAMKRLPECEAQPVACYQTNVEGTANVARACVAHGVKTAVFISTDKACKSISAYGSSKQLGEAIWRSYAPYGQFVGVRYGNVVASNGSVIPLWRKQAKMGVPLTLTNPDMTRFWMAPSAAVQLIVDACYLPPGAFLVPRMGALSIREMAEIIAPGTLQQIVGLRSVEKQHEDLVHPDELASETLTHYRVGIGETGHSYTSDAAPRLCPEAFLAMLEEAEMYD